MLGLPVEADYDTNFDGNVICWRRENVRKLTARLAAVAGRPWELALAAVPTVSEYVLYGLFIARILGETSGHYPESQGRTLTYQGSEPLADPALNALKDQLTARTIRC